jgi:hypothetical protein
MAPSEFLQERGMQGIRRAEQGDKVTDGSVALLESLDGCSHTDLERLVEAQRPSKTPRQNPPIPCSHQASYRRPDETLICLDCALVLQDASWIPQPSRGCASHIPYPHTPCDGPVRQCQACPAVWSDPCTCGSVEWHLDASEGTDVWRCRACNTRYGAPLCFHADALVHGPRTLCRVIHCGQTVYAPCSQCGSREWHREQTRNTAWWCKNCGNSWDAAACQG